MEAEVSLEVLSDLTDQTLERQLPYQQLGRLMVLVNFAKGDSAWPLAVGLLYASCGRGRLAGGFGSQLLAGRFATG